MAESSRRVPGRATAPRGDELVAEVADLLHQVNHRIRRAATSGSEPERITGAQMRAMRMLVRAGQPMRMSELAESLGIVRRSATSVVDDLEALGLARRVDDPTDRRAIDVELTEAGRRTMVEARQRKRSAATEVLGELDPADLSALRALLERLRC